MEFLIIALARWHMNRYCKLMSKVINVDITPDEIYDRIIRY